MADIALATKTRTIHQLDLNMTWMIKDQILIITICGTCLIQVL
jgi:hypothetical protein